MTFSLNHLGVFCKCYGKYLDVYVKEVKAFLFLFFGREKLKIIL